MASVVISAILAPKPQQPKPSGIGDFTVPTADQDRTIPVVFGRCWITGPNVVWYGDLSSRAIKEKSGGGGLFSDPRMKENTELVGRDVATGLGIHHFNYIDNPQRYEGLMADEVALLYPDAVTINENNGMMMVHYAKLGLTMREIN